MPADDDSLQAGGEKISARMGRANHKALCYAYGDIHSSWKDLESVQYLVAEANDDFSKEKKDYEEKNKSFDRMSLYYGDITDSNKSWEATIKTFYYILIVILVIIIVFKQDSDPLNYPIIAALIIIPVLLPVIVKLIY